MSEPAPQLILGSGSAGRRHLLTEAGVPFAVRRPTFEDPSNPNDADAEERCDEASGIERAIQLSRTLALAKGQSVPLTADDHPCVVVASDTIGVSPTGGLLGKPESREEASAMVRSLEDAEHAVVSGVAVRKPDGEWIDFADVASVHMGVLDAAMLEPYLDSELWRGKAAGYNLIERQDAGWPLTIQGDPATIVGLPMRRLLPMLAELGVHVPAAC